MSMKISTCKSKLEIILAVYVPIVEPHTNTIYRNKESLVRKIRYVVVGCGEFNLSARIKNSIWAKNQRKN